MIFRASNTWTPTFEKKKSINNNTKKIVPSDFDVDLVHFDHIHTHNGASSVSKKIEIKWNENEMKCNKKD